MTDMNIRDLLARTLQAEAGNQGYQGMLDVGSVIMNRANDGRYGEGVDGVIMRPGQFSAWNSVTGFAGGEQGQDMSFTPNEEAYRAADAILSNTYEDATGGATHYYAVIPGVSGVPSWSNDTFQARGDHYFGRADGEGAGRPTSRQKNYAATSKEGHTQPENALAGYADKLARYNALKALMPRHQEQSAEPFMNRLLG